MCGESSSFIRNETVYLSMLLRDSDHLMAYIFKDWEGEEYYKKGKLCLTHILVAFDDMSYTQGCPVLDDSR